MLGVGVEGCIWQNPKRSGQMWRQSPAATALSDDLWGGKRALVIKSKLDRRHSRVGRRPEDLSSMRCVLTCFSENTMGTPIEFKSRVWAVWVEETDTQSAQTGCKTAKKDEGSPRRMSAEFRR